MTEARQYRERDLIHISDNAYRFFMAMESERLTGFAQKIEIFFQGLFKDQNYFSRTLHGMSCYSFNKIKRSVPFKLTVF